MIVPAANFIFGRGITELGRQPGDRGSVFRPHSTKGDGHRVRIYRSSRVSPSLVIGQRPLILRYRGEILRAEPQLFTSAFDGRLPG